MTINEYCEKHSYNIPIGHELKVWANYEHKEWHLGRLKEEMPTSNLICNKIYNIFIRADEDVYPPYCGLYNEKKEYIKLPLDFFRPAIKNTIDVGEY